MPRSIPHFSQSRASARAMVVPAGLVRSTRCGMPSRIAASSVSAATGSQYRA